MDTVLPEGLEDRFRGLRRGPKVRAALRADREAAVERVVFGTARELWVPPVPLEPESNQPPPRLVDEPGPRDTLAGLDASGRAVLVRSAFGLEGEAPAAVLAHPSESADTWVIGARLLTWDDPKLEVVGFLTHSDVSHVTWIDHDECGRPVRFATAGVEHNDLGKGAEVASCEWEGDRCVRVRRQWSEDGRRWAERLHEAEYDERGLVLVRSNTHVSWRRDVDGYEEDPLAPDDALAVWMEAVAAAAARSVARAGVPDPAVIRVIPYFADDPSLVIVDRVYLEAAAAREEPRTAVRRLWEPRRELLPEIDAAGLRALRSLRQQELDDHQPAACEALLRRLATMSWPGGAIPIVYGVVPDEWDVAERVLGPERVDAVLGALPARAPAPAVERSPRSVTELAGLIGAFGLPHDLVRQSAWGLALAGGGRGRSRLGGRAELPEGMPWPECEGRALTHLATVVLSELPAFEGRDLLPAGGDLVFFADLTEEGELWEEVVVGEDARVRILHVPADTPTHEPEPPRDERDEYDSPAVLRRRKIAFRPVLTMPERPDGLDAAQRLGYEQLHGALLQVTPALEEPGHLLLGHPSVVQYDPRSPGQVSLLHVGWDEALGFEFLDGGDLTFYGDADDVRAGRWQRLRVSPESC